MLAAEAGNPAQLQADRLANGRGLDGRDARCRAGYTAFSRAA